MNFQNSKYYVEFGSKGEITSLKSGNKQFVSNILPLFQFRLRNGDKTALFNSNIADDISICRQPDCVIFKYSFTSINVVIVSTVHFADRMEFSLSFCNKSGEIIEWIDYPQIAVPNDLVKTGGTGRIIIDINEGLLVENLDEKEGFDAYRYREMEYPSEGLYGMFPAAVESQFLAYYDNDGGIYFAAEDRERSIKGVNFGPCENNSIKLQLRLYPGVTKTDINYDLPFNLVIDLFKGDWHDAAELYRTWFQNNLPKDLKKTAQNSDLPQWYTDSPLVIAYPVQGIHDMDEAKPNRLFPYNNALPYLDDISAKTGSRILTALMHWESTAPWAPPYVWPPLGGEALLKNFCNELHKRDFMLGVYCSGISFTINSNINDYSCKETYENENLERFMCAPPCGGKIASNTCQMQRSSYDMCISQDFTKEVLYKEAENMASSGLDYIQILDQNHGGTPYFCYSENHGHPPVPGKWMVEHMTEFLKTLKNTVGKNVLLGCESAGAEAYVPYLNLSDNRFNLNYAAGKPIPLYGYIYHEYLQNFSGNSVCSLAFIDIHKSPDCHLLRVAHSYLAGDLMTLVINQDGEIVWSWGERDFSVLPNRENVLNFVKCATAYRRNAAKKYLVFGKMIKPCNVECDVVEMQHPETRYITEYPAVLTNAFEANDGTKAQLFAGYRACDENIIVDLSATNGADLVDENGNIIKTLNAGINSLTIPATSIKMIVFKN